MNEDLKMKKISADITSSFKYTRLCKVVVGIQHATLLEEDRIFSLRIPAQVRRYRIQPSEERAVKLGNEALLLFGSIVAARSISVDRVLR